MPRQSHSPPRLWSRRQLLSTAGAGFGSLAFQALLQQDSSPAATAPQVLSPFAARTAHHTPRAKSVIYIFLSGGLAQQDSFDMKPDAPENVRGDFKPIATKTPGIEICEHLPMLAQRSNLWALCRSLTHPWNEHSQGHHIMLTGRSDLPPGFSGSAPQATDWPCIASIANAVTQPQNNLPPAVVLPNRLIHSSGRIIPGQFDSTFLFKDIIPYRWSI